MANKERGEISFTVKDRTYILKLTTGAMAELEDACSAFLVPERILKDAKGRETVVPAHEPTFPEILDRVMKGSMKYMRLYVWAGLLDKQPTLTVKQVGELMDEMGGVVGLWDVLKQLSDTAQPDPEDARPQTAQTTRRRGTGGRSTLKPVTSA